MEIITKRIGNVIDIGNSVGLTLREELLDAGLEPGDDVTITLAADNGKKRIIIEK